MPYGLYDAALPVVALTSAARTNGTVNGTTVDLGSFGNDFREAVFVIQAGTITDGTHTFKAQESADGSTGWVDVPANRILGAGPVLSSANSNGVASFGVKAGTNQYLRLSVTTATATTGGVYQAAAILSEGSVDPVNRS